MACNLSQFFFFKKKDKGEYYEQLYLNKFDNIYNGQILLKTRYQY